MGSVCSYILETRSPFTVHRSPGEFGVRSSKGCSVFCLLSSVFCLLSSVIRLHPSTLPPFHSSILPFSHPFHFPLPSPRQARSSREGMKIKVDNMFRANDAISKAVASIDSAKNFAAKNDADDNRKALQMLVDAAEQHNKALQELTSAVRKLRDELEKLPD